MKVLEKVKFNYAIKFCPANIIVLCFVILNTLNVNAQLKIQDHYCEQQVNPINVDNFAPRLGWAFEPTGFNQIQTAYEIIFSENENFKNSWGTGKIISSQNNNIVYSGRSLKSNTKYYWKVKTYNAKNISSGWSKPSWFETALLFQTDWKANWISDGSKQFDSDEDFYKEDPMPLFKKSFTIKKKIKKAKLFISGLGYYEAYLNGKKIGDRVLEPGWTTYSNQVLYSVYDITELLNQNENTAGIMLGNGWFNPLPLKLFSRFNLREFQQTGRPCLKAEFHINFEDGSHENIVTDSSWLTAKGPILKNNVYLGEQYDARLESDWLGTKTDVKNWKHAVVITGPDGKLTAQLQPAIRVTKIIKPISIRELANGKFIVDMGQNFAGVAHIKVKGAKGTTVKIKYGEALLQDGSLNYLTTVAGQIKEIWKVNGGTGAPPTAWQEDSYTLKGIGLEEWNPRFTFHGFRYVEISGWPGKPDLNSIEGLRMNSDIQPVGEFSCSNSLFNTIHTAVQWTFLSNVFSVQSDCPGREKMGYGADIVATANAYMFNYDMGNFYRKTVTDFSNDQQPDGSITEIAPFTGIADKGYGGKSGSIGWQLVFPYVQQQLYHFYGDKSIVEYNYKKVVRQLDFLKSVAINGLFHWDIGDHEAIDPKAEAFSASAFYYHHALLAKEFAEIVEKPDDALGYDKLANQIKNDIVNKYYIPGTGRFDNATQSAQLFALWYELSPEKDKTIQVLRQEFKRHNNHVSSGIFGVNMMFDVLRENNLNELAFEIANQKDFPSWGFMIEQGATTLWETWKYPDNAPSQNHPMFGSIDEWFYRSLLGINPAAPGFEKVIIKPQPVGDLTWAKGSYKSINGSIKSEWQIEQNQFKLEVTIPPNTSAQVYVPVKYENQKIETSATLKIDRYENGYAVYQVSSGNFTFSIADK